MTLPKRARRLVDEISADDDDTYTDDDGPALADLAGGLSPYTTDPDAHVSVRELMKHAGYRRWPR